MSGLSERNTKIGAVYPGFKAYYDQGYANGETFFEIDHLNGQTLEDMIDMALQHEDNVRFST